MHVGVIVRRGHRRWRNGHRKSLALGVRGVGAWQGVGGGVSGGLRVAPSRRTHGRRAALHARLELGLGRRRWGLVELDGDVAGGFGRAAASFRRRPRGFRVEVLAAVIAAVGQAGAVESRVGSVHLLFGVALHEQVDGHHTCTLGPASEQSGSGGMRER